MRHELTHLAAFHADSHQDRQRLVDNIRTACEQLGFFQLRNHGIPPDLQTDILEQSRDFFSLPVEIKERYDRGEYARNVPQP